ncbi:kininogen-1-like isoform X2 [Stegostoma tigrinum]|uniref:kininogen-1-like isoform X2 n=1 Tax=Stegostoma tigrinum TaxID=3053191 RepID=UPI00202AFFF4|nr:kininogen-1-like isoform X2 [Stegostoma tigrinum]
MAYGCLACVLFCFCVVLSATVSVKFKELFTRVPISDREANLAVDYAVNAYNIKSDNLYLFKQMQLKSAKYKAVGICKAEVFFEFGFQIKIPEAPSCKLITPVKRVVETVAVTCEGCPVSVSLDDPLVKASVELAVKAFNIENKKKRRFTHGKIIYAIKEAVIGEKYWVHFQIQETECQEDVNELWSNCPLKATDEAVLGHCYAEVLFPAGETKGQIRGLPKCQLFQPITDEDVDGVSCVGCPLPLRVNDPRVHRSVEYAISKFNDNSGQLYKFALARVLSAEHETSVGEEITLNFTLIETTCLNNNDTEPDTCGPKIPATAGSAICLTKQNFDIFGELLYHRLTCNVTQDWTLYAIDVLEASRNGTNSSELQPQKPTTPEPTVDHTTDCPTEPQNSKEPMITVKETKSTMSTDLLDQ